MHSKIYRFLKRVRRKFDVLGACGKSRHTQVISSTGFGTVINAPKVILIDSHLHMSTQAQVPGARFEQSVPIRSGTRSLRFAEMDCAKRK